MASRPSSGRAPCAPASAGLVAVNGDFFTEQGVPRGGAVLNGEPVRSVTTRKSRHVLVDERGRVAAGDLRLDVALVSADLQRITVDGVNCSLRGVGTVLYTPRYGASTRALEHDCGGLVDGTGRSTSWTSTLPHWAPLGATASHDALTLLASWTATADRSAERGPAPTRFPGDEPAET